MGQENSTPQPGDLIEINRHVYQHWALYMGDGDVIHLTPVDGGTFAPVSSTKAKVKKEPLNMAADNYGWRVNNKYDRFRTPRPVEEILRRAEEWIGRVVTYNLLFSNCEHFVTELRYGEALSLQLPLHSPRLPAALCPALSRPSYSCTSSLHAPEMGQDESKPQPGDLIEIDRPVYQHWALYVVNGYVIHVTDEGAHPSSGSITSAWTAMVKVKKELLAEVARNDKWRVNNKYDRSRTPRPVKEIIRRAERQIGREVEYDVINRNCEHFVTKLRYEVELCQQDEKQSSDGDAAAILAVLAGATAVILMVLSKI